MKYIKFISIVLFFLFITSSFAQKDNDAVLLKIAGDNVTKSEFLRVYQKNNQKDQPVDKKALQEYLELFINFKLKVKESEELKLDTGMAFKAELNGYRTQLTQPYLVDKDVTDDLIREAYDRMTQDVRASHLLIKLDKNASPDDTLKAYQKIMSLRKRIMAGESFEKVAAEASDDPSAKDTPATKERQTAKGNGGDLGYFSVFDMIYPFECGAYNTKVGDVSMPVRTDFGYHLIKVTDKKKAMGKVQVAHILIAVPQNPSEEDNLKAKQKADSVYLKLKNGEKFEDLVKQYTDDKGSAAKGGTLPEFGVNRMIPQFIYAISKLEKPGDITEPVLSRYGWHIIKLIEKKDIKPFEELLSDIKQKVTKDERSNKSKESFLANTKKEYNFKENRQALKDFYKVVTDSVFTKAWKAEEAKGLNGSLFTIGTKEYTQADFTDWLASKQDKSSPENIEVYVNGKYKDMVDAYIFKYADSKLEEKYPDFKALMKEYRDGILLFDLTDRNVWSKAIKDTVGMKEYYNNNKNNYMWSDRVDAIIFRFKDGKVSEKDAKSLVEKFVDKKYTLDDKKYLKLFQKTTKDSTAIITSADKFSKGDNKYIDQIDWKEGIANNITDGKDLIIIVVNKKLAPEVKTLQEAKGIITADYQNYLEKEWIKQLRSKYPYSLNKDVFDSIK
ncbi:MAG: peptidylprolyl isomerase [Bacteroidota bacterium]